MSFKASYCISLLSFTALAVVMILYALKKDTATVILHNTTTKHEFSNDSIIVALSATIFVTIPIAFELALDIFFDWKSGIRDRSERLSMILYIVIPSLTLMANRTSAFLPYLFTCLHVIQYVGCFGAIISVCSKLVPKYFTKLKSVLIHFFFVLSSIFYALTYSFDNIAWPHYFMLISLLLSWSIFLSCLYTWLVQLNLKSVHSLRYLPVNELSCLLYIATTLITIMALPGVVGCLYIFDMFNFPYSVILIFTYNIVGFSLLPSCIPGRLARYSFMLAQNKVHAEYETKWSMLRFISHELRSPLNVICTGAKVAIEDIHLDISYRLDNLHDIFLAGEAAVGLLDDIMSLQLVERNDFDLNPERIPASRIHAMLLSSSVLAAAAKPVPVKIAYAIGTNFASSLCNYELTLDTLRIEQVFRNVFVVISTYAAANTSINVQISYHNNSNVLTTKENASYSALGAKVTPATNNVNNNLPFTVLVPDGPPLDNKNNNITGNRNISDNDAELNKDTTHAGLVVIEFSSPSCLLPASSLDDNHREGLSSMFETVPLEGGGGIGLRFRISQEIVRKHEGALWIDDAIGTGDRAVTFSIALPCVERIDRAKHRIPRDKNNGQGSFISQKSRMQMLDVPQISTSSSEVGGIRTPVVPLMDPSLSNPFPDSVVEYGTNFVLETKPLFDERGDNTISRRPVNARSVSKSDRLDRAEDNIQNDFECNQEFICDFVSPFQVPNTEHGKANIEHSMRVLVVDDSDLNRRVMRRAVERLSKEYFNKNNMVFIIDEADDGLTAHETVKQALEKKCSYNLVLMDNIMHHMNGPEAATTMRGCGYLGYIAGVTGNVLPKDIKHFVDCGAECVLPKPLNLDRLREILNYIAVHEFA